MRILSVNDVKRSIDHLGAVDTRPQQPYLDVHLPYAVQIDVAALEEAALAGEAPGAAALLEVLSETSAAPTQPFLVYGDWRADVRRDGWVAWLLAHAGVPDVAVLDGSVRAWLRRRNLAIHKGHPILRGARLLRMEDLVPRPEIHIQPGSEAAAANTLRVLPSTAGDPVDGSREVRVDELLDDTGQFLFPDPLRALLDARGVDPDGRIALHGSPPAQGLAWVTLAGNGFEAAVVVARRAAAGGDAAP